MNQPLYAIMGRDVGVVHGTDHEAVPQQCIGKALGFEWRVGADKSIDSKNKIRRVAFSGQPPGHLGSPHEANLLAGGPYKGDVAVFEVWSEYPGSGHQGGAPDAVIEGASARLGT